MNGPVAMSKYWFKDRCSCFVISVNGKTGIDQSSRGESGFLSRDWAHPSDGSGSWPSHWLISRLRGESKPSIGLQEAAGPRLPVRLPHRPMGRLMWDQSAEDQSRRCTPTGLARERTRSASTTLGPWRVHALLLMKKKKSQEPSLPA